MDRNDLKKAMDQAQQMQVNLLKLQGELASEEIDARSSNNLVQVIMSGEGQFKHIKINPSAMNDIHVLEQSLLEALQKATEKAAELTRGRISEISKHIGL